MPQSGALDQTAPTTTASAGVYINGQLLTGAQEAELAQLIGEPVPTGRYVLASDGMFGLEGRSERVNLAALPMQTERAALLIYRLSRQAPRVAK